VVSYYYPPLGLDRVVRIAKFTKYLPQHGWDPTVLTVGDIGYFAFDYSLLEEVFEAGVVIERTKAMDLLRLFRKRGTIKMPSDGMRRLVNRITHAVLQPDGKIGWRRYAVKRALDIASQQSFDAILASAPPFTDFVVALDIHRALGLPLILDYREPWLDNRDAHFMTPFHKGIAAKMEEEALKSAERVVVANRKIKEKLIARYPFLTHESVHIVPTGYDPQDFHVASRLAPQRSRKMRITHASTFDTQSSPKPFFQALANLFARHPEMRDEIEACFIGPFSDAHRKLAVSLGVSSALVTPGSLEHHEIARHLLSSDLLWLNTSDPVVVPDALYPYIASLKPILAIVPEGLIRQTLAQYGAADTIDQSETAALADAIFARYEQWRGGQLPKGNPQVAREFDQRRLTELLARVLAYSIKIF
jgi:glycosyltransferase involved in cell wall biosynthesis